MMLFNRLHHSFGLAAVVLIAPAARLHITPTVELVKQTAVIRQTLAGARQFFLRDVEIGKADLAKIRQASDFDLDEPKVKFFIGKDAQGAVTGVVLFPQVNTSQHGPVEVGLTIGPDGKVARAIVTKATVETKPWVEEVIKSGYLSAFEGLPVSGPVDVTDRIPRDRLSAMPVYMGQVINQAVNEGVALYRVLYQGG